MSKREIEHIEGSPPALTLILREVKGDDDWATLRRRVRSIIKELREQSFVFDAQNAARKDVVRPTAFEVHLHGGLDLLGGDGCVEASCRVAAARRLARSLGLIADRVWLTDYLSASVTTMGRATNEALDALIRDAIAIAPLLPLIRAGVVGFRSAWIATCEDCQAEFDKQIEATTVEVLRSFRSEFKVKRRRDGGYFVETGNAFEPRMFLHSTQPTRTSVPSSRQVAEYKVAEQVKGVLWRAREAAMTGGAVFTNSRIGLLGLLQREGRLPDSRTLPLFESDRELSMPWVSDLSPEQILQLRQEAADALPAFRERLARAMVARAPESDKFDDVIAELREQAAEVRGELNAKRSKSARYWKATYGVLGLAVSAYGVATDQVIPAIGGLLPVLQLLISHKTGHEADVAKLTTRPGYVLVKAQDILEHAH